MGGTLAIVGAGGHGKVVADCAQLMNIWNKIIFFDEQLDDFDGFDDLLKHSRSDMHAFVAIGNNQVRENLTSQLISSGFEVPVIRHPASIVASESTIGSGSVLVAGSIVNPGASLGLGCILNTNSCVDHDCTIGDYVHISPAVALAGNVTIGDRTWIGIGAIARDSTSIGKDVMVAAGAVVVNDVANTKMVKGVPAK